MDERRWLLNVGRGTIVTILVLNALVFLWVILVGSGTVPTPNVALRVWVYGGVAVFAVTLVYLLLALIPRRERRPRVARGRAEVLDLAEAEAPLPPPRRLREEEIRYPKELHKGQRVVEISHPPKSSNRGGIYAKAVIALDGGWVLRIEELVAQRSEAELART